MTIGIYAIYWYYRVNRELRDHGAKVNPAIAVVALLLGLLLVIPAVVSIYNTGKRIAELQRNRGVRPPAIGLIGTLLMLAYGGGIIYYQAQLNKVWRQ